MQSLIDEAGFAFKDWICACLISADKEAFLAWMKWAHPCIVSELSQFMISLQAVILELSVHLWRSSSLCLLFAYLIYERY